MVSQQIIKTTTRYLMKIQRRGKRQDICENVRRLCTLHFNYSWQERLLRSITSLKVRKLWQTCGKEHFQFRKL